MLLTMRHVVGKIESYDVYYIVEKQVLFCKNTACKLRDLEDIILGGMDRGEIPEKNLRITKLDGVVTLGCLTTTKNNCLEIRRNCYKLNKKS